jgi:hypothetical protein
MGKARGRYQPRVPEGYVPRRDRGNAGPSGVGRKHLATGESGRFLPEHPRPVVGDRFGELEVVGLDLGPREGLLYVRVRCSCGGGPHRVHISNLRRGASTRCNACAKQSANLWRKNWFKYEAVCPDPEHRRRLCNRISACYNRCHNPNDAGYRNYGARGIQVYGPWRTDRAAFLGYLVSLEGWDRSDLELDRIDNERGYEPGNLRFVSKRENRNNVRKVQALQQRIVELEERLRRCSCGAAKPFHNPD